MCYIVMYFHIFPCLSARVQGICSTLFWVKYERDWNILLWGVGYEKLFVQVDR